MEISKDSSPKFALIGTSSAGKTTLVYELCGKLKKQGIRVDSLLQQDRRLCFDKKLLDTHKEAQYWFIFNMIAQEQYMALKFENDLILSDRSAIDFYAYYETIWGRDEMLFSFIKEYSKTYKALYYLNPVKYDNDGQRPTEDFRDKVDNVLNNIISEMYNVFTISRDDILKDILGKINRILSNGEISLIPSILDSEVLLGGSYAFNRQTKFSDVDIYISGNAIRKRPDLSDKLKIVFGLKFDVNEVLPEIYEYLKTQGFKIVEKT